MKHVLVGLLFASVVCSVAPGQTPRKIADPKAKGGFSGTAKGGAAPAGEIGEPESLKFEAPIDDVILGGRGRYVLGVMRSLRKVAVYDASTGKMDAIDLPNEECLVTAGMDKMVVIYPDQLMMERYSLSTKAKEKKSPLPVRGVIKTAVMGSGSKGPLLVMAAAGTGALDSAGYIFIDISNMKVIPIASGKAPRNNNFRDKVHIRASSNGAVFGLWNSAVSPSGLETFVASGKSVFIFSEHETVGHVLPAPDGRMVFTESSGVYTPDLKAVQRSVLGVAADGAGDAFIPSPSSATFFLAISGFSDGAPRSTRRARRPAAADNDPIPGGPRISILQRGKSEPVARVEGAPEMAAQATSTGTKGDFTNDKRYILLPEAGKLVTVPATNDQLVVRSIKLPPSGR